jgi:seryl-tRNA synthetase
MDSYAYRQTLNRLVVVIEGDGTVDPDRLTVYAPDGSHVDVHYVSRDDDQAADPVEVRENSELIADVARSVYMAQTTSELNARIDELQEKLRAAMDQRNPDTTTALETIQELMDKLHDARAAIRAAAPDDKK